MTLHRQRPKPKATVFFCTSLRTAPTVSSGVLVRSTDTKLRHENRETHAGMAIFANPKKKLLERYDDRRRSKPLSKSKDWTQPPPCEQGLFPEKAGGLRNKAEVGSLQTVNFGFIVWAVGAGALEGVTAGEKAGAGRRPWPPTAPACTAPRWACCSPPCRSSMPTRRADPPSAPDRTAAAATTGCRTRAGARCLGRRYN